jgi:hypothetical protein
MNVTVLRTTASIPPLRALIATSCGAGRWFTAILAQFNRYMDAAQKVPNRDL